MNLSTTQHSTRQCNTTDHNATQRNAIQRIQHNSYTTDRNTMQRIATQCNATQHTGVMDYNTTHRNTTDHNTTEHNLPQHSKTGNENHAHMLNKPVEITSSSTGDSTEKKTVKKTLQVYPFWFCTSTTLSPPGLHPQWLLLEHSYHSLCSPLQQSHKSPLLLHVNHDSQHTGWRQGSLF